MCAFCQYISHHISANELMIKVIYSLCDGWPNINDGIASKIDGRPAKLGHLRDPVLTNDGPSIA
jgi:hypothetical protein